MTQKPTSFATIENPMPHLKVTDVPLRTVPRSDLDRRMDEFDLARKTLKWMIEHKVYWDGRSQALLAPVSLVGRLPFIEPPTDVQVYLHSLVREIDLDAESAT